MGLPGATLESFSEDLQQAVDREIPAIVYPTQLLRNSPMNEPAYRDRFAIEVEPNALSDDVPVDTVVATSTFTRDEFERMRTLRRVFLLTENLGVLRHVARFVRQETGAPEMAFYRTVIDVATTDASRWPALDFVLRWVPDYFVPPASWALFIDELAELLVTTLGLADDSTLRTVMAVQHALLPSRLRPLPQTIQLEHDYVAWFTEVQRTKISLHEADWADVVPPLRTFGPGSLVIDDPLGVGNMGLGHSCVNLRVQDDELSSALARPRAHTRSAPSTYTSRPPQPSSTPAGEIDVRFGKE